MKKLYKPESISINEMKLYGYMWDGMFPLSKEQALKVFDMNEVPVYLLHNNNSESEANNRNDIIVHASYGGIFGIERFDSGNLIAILSE